MWVRKHLRGGISCEWGGFDIVVVPPTAWDEENTHWKQARAFYKALPKEEREAWRDAIRLTYAPMAHWTRIAKERAAATGAHTMVAGA